MTGVEFATITSGTGLISSATCLLIDARSLPASIFDLDVSPFDPSQIAHTQAKRLNAGLRFRIVFIEPDQHADPPYSIWLLWPRGAWPGNCRANNNFDKISPAHVTLRSQVKHEASFSNSIRLGRRCPLWVIRGHSAVQIAMSALPRKRTFRHVTCMSAKGQKRRDRVNHPSILSTYDAVR
jgi:hypothetical protein